MCTSDGVLMQPLTLCLGFFLEFILNEFPEDADDEANKCRNLSRTSEKMYLFASY